MPQVTSVLCIKFFRSWRTLYKVTFSDFSKHAVVLYAWEVPPMLIMNRGRKLLLSTALLTPTDAKDWTWERCSFGQLCRCQMDSSQQLCTAWARTVKVWALAQQSPPTAREHWFCWGAPHAASCWFVVVVVFLSFFFYSRDLNVRNYILKMYNNR